MVLQIHKYQEEEGKIGRMYKKICTIPLYVHAVAIEMGCC